jgi:tetratricopeptide (TPR) repeat protein
VALLSGPAGYADEAANTVIGVNPRLSEGAYALEFGNYDEGVRLTLEGLRSSVRPADRVGALSNLCAGYVGLQDYQEALRYCNRALRIDENNWHAYNNRSLAYLGLGNTAAAERDLAKGLEINPHARTLKEVELRVEAAKKAEAKQGEAVSSPPEEED